MLVKAWILCTAQEWCTTTCISTTSSWMLLWTWTTCQFTWATLALQIQWQTHSCRQKPSWCAQVTCWFVGENVDNRVRNIWNLFKFYFFAVCFWHLEWLEACPRHVDCMFLCGYSISVQVFNKCVLHIGCEGWAVFSRRPRVSILIVSLAGLFDSVEFLSRSCMIYWSWNISQVHAPSRTSTTRVLPSRGSDADWSEICIPSDAMLFF